MMCLIDFTQAVYVKRLLHEKASTPAQTFWCYLMGVLADRAVIQWCKVFGSNKDDTHWTNAIPSEHHHEIRVELHRRTGLDEAGWLRYRDELVSYRDQFAAHHDLDPTLSRYPHFDTALVAAQFMYERLSVALAEEEQGDLPRSLDSTRRYVNNMGPIVSLAFGAASQLGSNMRSA